MKTQDSLPNIHQIPYENSGLDRYIPVVANARLIYLANESLIQQMVAKEASLETILLEILQHPMPPELSIINFSLLAITSRCDIRCCYCKRQFNCGELPLSIGKQIIDEAITEMRQLDFDGKTYPFHLPYTTFSGGESLLHQHVVELVAHASAHGLRPNIITNGHFLTREMSEKLLDAKVGGIQISLDSSDPAIQKEMTGEDVVQKWVALNRLQDAMLSKKRFPELLVNIVMTKENIGTLDKTVKDILHCLKRYIDHKKGRYINFLPVALAPEMFPSHEQLIDFRQRVSIFSIIRGDDGVKAHRNAL